MAAPAKALLLQYAPVLGVNPWVEPQDVVLQHGQVQEEADPPLLSAELTRRKIRQVGVPPWKEPASRAVISSSTSRGLAVLVGCGGTGGGEEGEEEVAEAEETRRPRGRVEAVAARGEEAARMEWRRRGKESTRERKGERERSGHS
uniref:Uncharacterized protein n=1 Tax=Aegilops tauschii TaxID=37682 RepID=M8CAB6_AEGTA